MSYGILSKNAFVLGGYVLGDFAIGDSVLDSKFLDIINSNIEAILRYCQLAAMMYVCVLKICTGYSGEKTPAFMFISLQFSVVNIKRAFS